MKKSILIFVLTFLSIGFNRVIAQSDVQLTPDGIFDNVSDNYGNSYKLADLLVDNTKMIGGGGNIVSTPSISCQSGYFTLYYTGTLFSTGTQSAQAKNLVCDVFGSISSLITSTIPAGAINIEIKDLAASTSSYAAKAFSFYIYPQGSSNPNQGIILSQVQKALLTGVDPYANIPVTAFIGGNGFYHGNIEVDPTLAWNTGTTTTIGGSEYSLYSAMFYGGTIL